MDRGREQTQAKRIVVHLPPTEVGVLFGGQVEMTTCWQPDRLTTCTLTTAEVTELTSKRSTVLGLYFTQLFENVRVLDQ